MKIAITAFGTELNLPVDVRFGRAPGFILFDTVTDTNEFHSNSQNLQAAQGAGIQSAQNVAQLGAEAVITGHCGPKAFRVLQAAKIKIFCVPDTLTIQQAIVMYKDGELAESTDADVEGHWV